MDFFDAYAAGILDADGCITIIRAKRGKTIRHVLRVEVSMCCKPLIERLKTEYGGSVTYRPLYTLRRPKEAPGIRDIWMWIAGAQIAYNFIRRVQPWLIVKAAEADLAIEFQEGISKTTGFTLPLKELKRRDRLADACSALKRQRYSYSTTNGPGASSH